MAIGNHDGEKPGIIALVRQLRNGNNKVMDMLLQECTEPISRFTNKYANGRVRLDKAVIVSKVLEKVIKGISEFCGDSEAEIKKWLDVITQHTVEDEYRKIKKHPTIPLGDAPPEAASSNETPLDVCIEKEQCQIIHRAIKEMPEIYRNVLLLFYWRKMKYKDIARLLKIPLGTVRSRHNEARKILRKKLGHFSGEDQ